MDYIDHHPSGCPEPIPITILIGFLGAGKTTLLNGNPWALRYNTTKRMAFRFSLEMRSHMAENHQDKTESKLTATEDVEWVRNKKRVPKYKKRTGLEDATRIQSLTLIIGVIVIPLSILIGITVFAIRTGLEDATRIQSLTEVIGVIVIPLSILIGVAEFAITQQHTLQGSIDEQQQTTLQNYFGNMSDLLLKENLRGSKSQDVVRQVAQAQTLMALENLNPARKRAIVKFLYESGLILSDPTSKTHSIITLNSADLSGADLSGVNLSGADLSGANLNDTNLRGALVTQEQLDRAKSLQGATMPDGSIHP
jgi:Pentapeptide repeats (8 copies)